MQKVPTELTHLHDCQADYDFFFIYYLRLTLAIVCDYAVEMLSLSIVI